jgi:hypothetical protein
MGTEAKCTATFKGKTYEGQVRLEPAVLQFRGARADVDLKLSIPFDQIRRVAAQGGTLAISFRDGTASFELGAAAAKSAAKIQHPPTRLDKLGVKPNWRASVSGVTDTVFLKDLEDRIEYLSIGRIASNSDVISLGVTKAGELARLDRLKASLKPDGALWVVRPKGRPEITERDVMVAGKAAGLVDVKVVSFSPTHTAEKFVIPVKDRERFR